MSGFAQHYSCLGCQGHFRRLSFKPYGRNVLHAVFGHGFGVQSPLELRPGYDVEFVISTQVKMGNKRLILRGGRVSCLSDQNIPRRSFIIFPLSGTFWPPESAGGLNDVLSCGSDPDREARRPLVQRDARSTAVSRSTNDRHHR